jgi:DNA polymerase III delta prime subunit
MKQVDIFDRLLKKGYLWLVLGLPGTGKTTVAIMFAQSALKHGWEVISNIALCRWVPEEQDFVWTTYPGYHHATSWAEAMTVLPDILDKEKNCLLLLDEPLLSDIGGGQQMSKAQTRAVVSFFAQARKVKTASIIITQGPKMVSAVMRTPGVLIRGKIIKGLTVPGYGREEVAVISVPDPASVDSDKPEKTKWIKKILCPIRPTGLARSPEMIRLPDGKYDPTQVIFDSDNPSSMELGEVKGKMFDLAGLIKALGKVKKRKMLPQTIRDFMAHPEAFRPARELDTLEDNSYEETGHEEAESGYGELKQDVIDALLSGEAPGDVSKRLQCARSYVYEVRKQLVEAGRL